MKNIPGPNLSVNLQQRGRTCKLRPADQVRAGYLVSDPLFPFFWPNFFLDRATPTSSCPGWKYLLFVSLLPPIGFCVQCHAHWVTSYYPENQNGRIPGVLLLNINIFQFSSAVTRSRKFFVNTCDGHPSCPSLSP